MNELKLKLKNADVFHLPVNNIVLSLKRNQIKPECDDGVTPWDYIDRAINEYDSLVEENKQLRKKLKAS